MVGYNTESSLTVYLRKQKKFESLVNSVQNAISSKDYRKQGYTLNSYVKKKWNISKAQAYRYLISAKVLEQLKEFEILPSKILQILKNLNYERLCKTISTLTKTEEQVKLLWKSVIRKVENRLDEIDTSFITKVWKELCQDEKYSFICHSENNVKNNNKDIKKKYSETKEFKFIPSNSKINNNNLTNSFISSPSYTEDCIIINNNSSQNSSFPSPSYTKEDFQSINDNSSKISYFPSPSYTETDLQNINYITFQKPFFSPLSTMNSDIINSNMNDSKQLDINSNYYLTQFVTGIIIILKMIQILIFFHIIH